MNVNDNEDKQLISRKFALSVILLTVAGAILRLVHMNSTISCDEAFTVQMFLDKGLAAILSDYSEYGSNNNHMLNSLLALLSTRLLGHHEWSLRLPAYLFGVATIPMTAILVVAVMKDRAVALAAAAIATFSPILIAYTYACRGYSMMVFFAVACAWLVLKTIEKPSIPNVLTLAVSGICLGLSHMAGLVPLGALGIYCIVIMAAGQAPKKRELHIEYKSYAIVFAVLVACAISLVLWYSRIFNIFADITSGLTQGEFVEGSPLSRLGFMGEQTNWRNWIGHSTSTLFGAPAVYYILVIAGMIVAIKRRSKPALLICLVVLVPVISFTAARLTPNARYLQYIVPFAHVLVACSVCAAGRWLGTKVSANLDVVITCALTAGICVVPASALISELGGPGSRHLGTLWNCKDAATYLVDKVEEQDLVLSFPCDESSKGTGPWIRGGFHNSMRYYITRNVMPEINARPDTHPGMAIWYLTPEKDLIETTFLPEDAYFDLVNELENCFIYKADIPTDNMRKTPVPGFEFADGELRTWTLRGRHGSAEEPTGKVIDASEKNDFVTIRMMDEPTAVDIFSQKLDVVPGKLVQITTEMAREPNDVEELNGQLSVQFYDVNGQTVPYADANASSSTGTPDSDGWIPTKLARPVPHAAHTMQIWMTASNGFSGNKGSLRLREPTLQVDWSESRMLEETFRLLDKMPIPADMDQFKILPIENPDLIDENGAIPAWTQQIYSGETTVEPSQLVGIENSRFIRATTITDNSSWAIYSTPIPITEEATLRLIADLTGKPESAQIVIRFFDAKDKPLTEIRCIPHQTGKPMTPGSRWYKTTMDWTAPKNAAKTIIGLRVTDQSRADNIFYFRPVRLWVRN